MTAVVLANVLLAIPFLIAFIGIPLWLTFRRPHTGADHSQAHAYLRAKAALAGAGAPAPGRGTSGARSGRPSAGRVAAGHRSAAPAGRDHAHQATRRAGASV